MTRADIIFSDERFWSKVDKSGDCWNWQASTHRNGYGQFMVFRRGRKTMMLAHRVAYLIAEATLPDDLQICHHCDNRKCMRHDHLFVGTATDNMQDMSRKGRGKKTGNSGERNAAARLTADKVAEIRRRFDAGWSGYALALAFGVGSSTIYRAVRGRCWRHLGALAERKTAVARPPLRRCEVTGRFLGEWSSMLLADEKAAR